MSLTVKKLSSQDCQVIAEAFTRQGWLKPIEQYERSLREVADGLREVLVADLDGEFAGYLNVVWKSPYPPFRDRHIPEITDLNVLIKFRKLGVATQLMDEAESLISQRSETAGIRVGLTADYGPAQRLYVRRGYIPDGFGLSYDRESLQYGDKATVDDELTLGFTKQVRH
jgi:ribosomal protein S18 acetylase RimI-like enzyme